MTLLQLCAGQIRLNSPLPWNVRGADTRLLLSKGQVLSEQRQIDALLSRGVYVDQEDFDRARRDEVREATSHPIVQWNDLLRKAGSVLRAPQANPQFRPQLDTLTGQLLRIIETDPDMGAFALAHMEGTSYPVLHALQTAFVSLQVCRRLGLPQADCEAGLRAGLTMNLSMMDLQARLSDQGHPLTALQRAEVRSHPQRSHDLLVQLGVTDATWLQAVLDHHECDGGGGYPRGCTAVSPLATVLHHADVYLAKVSARTHRPALPVDQAARDLFTQNGSGGNPVVAAIVKEMGLYPPGSCVKLDNGDTAVVLRRGEHAATPRVVALCDAAGVPYPQPMPRDTRQARFKVRKPVARTNLRVRIDGPALYAL